MRTTTKQPARHDPQHTHSLSDDAIAMRESNFAFPAQNKACVCITSQLYDRRALDTTAPLPLFNSLTHLTYLTSTSPRIREIMTMDGGLERLVKILHDFCFSPPPPENPTVIYGLLPPNSRPPKPQPTLNPPVFDKHAAYRFSLAFQCVVNIGVRGSEQIRRRVVQSGTLDVVGCILEAWLASKGFAVGPSSSATGVPRETREQRHARRQAAIENRQREEALALTRALQRTQMEQMQMMQAQQTIQPQQTQRPPPAQAQAQTQSSRLQLLQQRQQQQTTRLHDLQTTSGSSQRNGSVAEEDESMDISLSPRTERSFISPTGTSTTSSSFTRPSTSTSASNSDTDLSTNNSMATTPLGTGTPTGVVVIPNRERSGTVIARPVWDATPAVMNNINNNNNSTTITPQALRPRRASNLSNSTIVNVTANTRPQPAASPSPSHSTDTSRPDTETEDDGDGEGETEDVDMEDTTQSTASSLSLSIVISANTANGSSGVASTSASTSVSASPSPERQASAPPPPHRTRLSLSRRAVGIVSEGAPAAQTLPGIEGAHHIIINEDLGDLGVGVGVGVGVNVGVEDGIVSLDQQATEDFAMGAPPGAPGAIEGTPRFGMGRHHTHGHGHPHGHPHNHGHGHGHTHAHTMQHPAPDVTPRAVVVGLPNETPSPRMGGMRGRAGTAPEMYTEPLIPVPGPSTRTAIISGGGTLGLGPRTESGSGVGVIPGDADVGVGSSSAATTTTSAASSATGASFVEYTPSEAGSPIGSVIPLDQQREHHQVHSPDQITATNTISSTASTSSATTTPTTTTPTYPGPYRDEDVLLGLQLLAYLSKYPHVRQAFYKPRQSFHPATVVYQAQQQQQTGVGGNNGKGKAPMIPAPTQKDGGYFKTFNGSSVMTPASLPASAGSGSASAGSGGNGVSSAVSSVAAVISGIGIGRSGKERAGGGSSGGSGVSLAGGVGAGGRQTNVFSLVERFTFKPSSSELAANGGSVPRLPPEIQYWAGVVMRNACRKDDNRGGIRQCANMLCGRWEAYPREFAKCRRCRKAKYCGKECQSTAWSEGHRFWCSAKDVEEDGGGAGNDGGSASRSHHHNHGHGHHGHGHAERERERERDGDEEDSGGRRDRRRDRDRRDDGADTATQVPRGSRVRPPPPSSPVEGRRRAETVTGERTQAGASSTHDMVLG
ncbi:hypothetical protein P691DRAFT_777117 [Macrolepiota fuliginosa MF-IS2]|uniref:MYND-type domain-containing protein n=1 Tax=Macrolepiota fuliginosa MF-IS2 TaxID=1400762 RepID=A0A9P5X7T4_9AGAR|nr:hypothetical protein P691DRAFT_777117 [Macrolepiota fuliginosa MF-IS2]